MAQEQLASNNGIMSGFVSYNGAEVGSIDGYIALPNDRKAHPGVILIQEWWGIEPHIQELTQRLAREGYIVLAPDLFHGKVATEPDEAMKATMALNRDAAVAEVRSGIDYLQQRDDVQPKQVGVVGFCMGGLLVWRIAELENGELAAIAPFYAAHYHPSAEDIARVSAPALVVWGEQDASISAQDRQHITQLLQQQGKTHQALVYPAGHAFMNDRHGDYDQPSAEQAWSALLAWFRRYRG